MLSVFALDSAFVTLAVGIVYGWTRSLRGAAICFAVFITFAVAYPPIVNSDWMPYMYVPTYVVFVIAAGSVVAGRSQDAWIFALTGWFLIHGQACFLFFVPVLTLAVLAAVLWPHRRTLRASAGSFFREQRRVWVPVGVISAVFAFPIVLNLVLRILGTGRRPQPAPDRAVRAVVLVAAPVRMAGAGATLRTRAGRYLRA
jgi:hypothetical protein